VPTAFAADVLRRSVIVIAAWLIALQAFLSGVATAQAGVLLAPASLDAGTICHGADASTPADSTTPDADKLRQLCCVFCATASSAAVPREPAKLVPVVSWGRAEPPALTRFAISMARGAVRAGTSQAPPHLA
jgi:hypothetical protein